MNPVRYPQLETDAEHIKPLGDLVLVRPLPEEEKVGSIFLPENARNPERGLRRGVVVACGPGDKVPSGFNWYSGQGAKPIPMFKRIEMHVKPGDTIIFPRVPANVVNIGGEELVLLREEQHVLAVLEE